MLNIILLILVFAISFFIIFKYNLQYMDIDMFFMSFFMSLIITVFVFIITMPIQFSLMLNELNTHENVSTENYSIDNVFIVKNITTTSDRICFETNYSTFDYNKENVFFVESDSNDIVTISLRQYSPNRFSYLRAQKAYVYIPSSKYNEYVNNLLIDKNNRISNTYLDLDKILKENDINTKKEDVVANDEKLDISDIDNTITEKDTIIMSIPIFKYNHFADEYVIRCNNGEILTLPENIINIKETNDIQYIDKILTNFNSITGEQVQVYTYDLYINNK